VLEKAVVFVVIGRKQWLEFFGEEGGYKNSHLISTTTTAALNPVLLSLYYWFSYLLDSTAKVQQQVLSLLDRAAPASQTIHQQHGWKENLKMD